MTIITDQPGHLREYLVDGCIVREIPVGDGFLRGADEIDLNTCKHLAHLLLALKTRIASIDRFMRDPLWAERVAAPDVREMILDELANLGMALAQLTLLVEDPPGMDRIAAEIQRDLIERDKAVAFR